MNEPVADLDQFISELREVLAGAAGRPSLAPRARLKKAKKADDEEELIARRLAPQSHAAALASDHGPIFSTVAKLVDALNRTQNAELKKEACGSRVNHSAERSCGADIGRRTRIRPAITLPSGHGARRGWRPPWRGAGSGRRGLARDLVRIARCVSAY